MGIERKRGTTTLLDLTSNKMKCENCGQVWYSDYLEDKEGIHRGNCYEEAWVCPNKCIEYPEMTDKRDKFGQYCKKHKHFSWIDLGSYLYAAQTKKCFDFCVDCCCPMHEKAMKRLHGLSNSLTQTEYKHVGFEQLEKAVKSEQ